MRARTRWALVGIIASAAQNATVAQTGAAPDPTQEAVFRIVLDRSSGTGFLIDPEGWAITNYHVVRDGRTAKAVFRDGYEAPVELWDAWPDYDLALLKVELSAPRAAFTVVDEAPKLRTPVRAAGYPRHGYTETEGIVNGIRNRADVPELDDMNAASVWIEHDARINGGNSGGPLIDKEYRVVGVNTFVLYSDFTMKMFNNIYLALSAQHIGEIMQQRPDDPMGFGGTAPPARLVIDLPSINVEQKRSARSVVEFAYTISRASKCRPCRGTGRVTARVQRGWRGSGTFRNPNMRNEYRTCSTCDGRKLNGLVLQPNLERFAHGLAAVADDQINDRALVQAIELIREGMQTHREGSKRAIAIEARGRETQVGDPLIFSAGAILDLELSNFDSPVYFTDARVIARDVRLVSQPGASQMAIGGVLAGYLGDDPDTRIPVIQHGFIIGY